MTTQRRPWDEVMAEVADHYASLAQRPGWWAYAREQVIAMEGGFSGAWVGLRALVGQRIKSAGFKPAQNEAGEWWNPPSNRPQEVKRPSEAARRATGWRSVHAEYLGHTQTCKTCVAAGIGSGVRCEVGGEIWNRYTSAVDGATFLDLMKEPWSE
jgi:hypothetical protein